MVVVHVTSAKNASGGVRQLLYLMQWQKRLGHRPVLCAHPGCRASKSALEMGVEVYPLTFGGLAGQWRSSRQLRRIVGELGADIVHTHHTKGHNVGVLATIGFGGFPPLLVKRGVLYKPSLSVKFRTKRVTAIVTNSDAVRRVLEGVGVRPGKVRVIPNGKQIAGEGLSPEGRHQLCRELGLDPSRPVVGAVGNGSADKGFQYLVEAAPAVVQMLPGVQFVLVGSGADHLRGRLQELGVEGDFRIVGHRTDALEVMGLFDIFVFPGINKDSCPNVVLEAMSLGLPVISSDMEGMEEVVTDRTGLLVPAGQGGPLGEAIVSLLGDPRRLKAMGEAALERVATFYDPQDKALRTLALYDELVGG